MGKAISGVGGLIGNILGMDTKAKEPASPAPMPDEDRIAAAKRRAMASNRAGGGAMSTLLSGGGGGEKLG